MNVWTQWLLLIIPVVAFCSPALGDAPRRDHTHPPAAAAQSRVGTDSVASETEAWLDLQRSGREAAAPRPLSGDVASRIYQRYLKSFTHPIPESFENHGAQGTR